MKPNTTSTRDQPVNDPRSTPDRHPSTPDRNQIDGDRFPRARGRREQARQRPLEAAVALYKVFELEVRLATRLDRHRPRLAQPRPVFTRIIDRRSNSPSMPKLKVST